MYMPIINSDVFLGQIGKEWCWLYAPACCVYSVFYSILRGEMEKISGV